MQNITFTKMVASGNDFVVIDGHKASAQKICDRKYGVGADGLLVLEKSGIADVKMRVFNADGSEAEMCGNGARCVALWLSVQRTTHNAQLKIETKAGIIQAEVNKDNVRIKLTSPKGLKIGIPLKINSRMLKANFINTGVPHTVIFVEGLDKIDIANLGRLIRNHNKFAPKGTNVDFVEVISRDTLRVRTYERGVEDETLACGTGAVASSLIANRMGYVAKIPVKVKVRSAEELKVYFRKIDKGFKDVWLEGRARIVYKGVYHV
ncbi:MAG: diaminopimelate epimerase [Candidatus Omnitrophota bacterium]